MPTVINRHHFKGKALPRPYLYVGRGTPLGNPFTMEKHGRTLAIELYQDWLRERLAFEDGAVLKAIRSITNGHHLVCSCAPKPCHADVILEEWKREMGVA